MNVRIIWSDGETCECTLASFLEANAETLNDADVRALREGRPITLGGGAAPMATIEPS